MPSWFHLYVDNPDEALRVSTTAKRAAFSIMDATQNYNVAVFSCIDEVKSGVHFYFSPDAQSVALTHGAVECRKPTLKEVGRLLCCDQTVIKRFFG